MLAIGTAHNWSHLKCIAYFLLLVLFFLFRLFCGYTVNVMLDAWIGFGIQCSRMCCEQCDYGLNIVQEFLRNAYNKIAWILIRVLYKARASIWSYRKSWRKLKHVMLFTFSSPKIEKNNNNRSGNSWTHLLTMRFIALNITVMLK